MPRPPAFFNPAPLRAAAQTEKRYRELEGLGLNVKLVIVGRKAITYFARRPAFNVVKTFILGAAPTTREAGAVADEVFADFVSKEVDKVELVYTKFVSLITANPTIQTLLPLTPTGELCDVDGNCVDAAQDELFKLTTVDGKLAVEREKVSVETARAGPLAHLRAGAHADPGRAAAAVHELVHPAQARGGARGEGLRAGARRGAARA